MIFIKVKEHYKLICDIFVSVQNIKTVNSSNEIIIFASIYFWKTN